MCKYCEEKNKIIEQHEKLFNDLNKISEERVEMINTLLERNKLLEELSNLKR